MSAPVVMEMSQEELMQYAEHLLGWPSPMDSCQLDSPHDRYMIARGMYFMRKAGAKHPMDFLGDLWKGTKP